VAKIPEVEAVPVADETTFALHLAALRTRAGLTVAAAAAASGVSVEFWTGMEAGSHFPSTHQIRQIALAVGTRPHLLL